MDTNIWSNLPKHILYHHILTKCDIDTKLAFHIKPAKKKLSTDIVKLLNCVPTPKTQFDYFGCNTKIIILKNNKKFCTIGYSFFYHNDKHYFFEHYPMKSLFYLLLDEENKWVQI